MRSDILLLAGALFGLTAVALGAYVEHGLQTQLSARDLASLDIALRYQLLHAILLVAIGLSGQTRRLVQLAAAGFIGGLFCFCGGIYLAIIGGMPAALHLAPIGGTLLMLGWLLLAVASVSRPRR